MCLHLMGSFYIEFEFLPSIRILKAFRQNTTPLSDKRSNIFPPKHGSCPRHSQNFCDSIVSPFFLTRGVPRAPLRRAELRYNMKKEANTTFPQQVLATPFFMLRSPTLQLWRLTLGQRTVVLRFRSTGTGAKTLFS